MNKLHGPKILFLLAALTTLTGACGDDDDDDDGNNGGTSGRATAGRSGSSSTAGRTGTGGAGAPGTTDGGEPGAVGGEAPVGAGGNEAAGAPGAAGQGTGGGGGDGGATALSLSDAQVLLVLDTLNQGEVEVAYAALPRLADPDVKDFAQEMVLEHGAARQDVLGVADSLGLAPLPSELQAALKDKGEATVRAFQISAAEALDGPYVDGQVADHAAALALLNELADTADEAELKELIAALHATVEMHYEHVLQLDAAVP